MENDRVLVYVPFICMFFTNNRDFQLVVTILVTNSKVQGTVQVCMLLRAEKWRDWVRE